MLFFVAAPGLAAQLGALEEEYEAARALYEQVIAERSTAQTSYNRLLDVVRAARRSDDEGQLSGAMATFYTQARALEAHDRRLEELDRRLVTVGRELTRALDEREEELLARLEATADSDERQELLESLAEVRQRVRQVEAEVESLQEMPVLPVPDVQPDPRDGPTELRAKQNLLVSRVREFDAVLEEIDDRLDALDRRLRRDRTIQDQEAGLARFDDLRIVPRVPTAGQPRTEGMSSDLQDEGLAGLPIEEQMALLVLFREQAEMLREETQAQAEEFGRRIPGGGR